MAYSTDSLRKLRLNIGKNIHKYRARRRITLRKLSSLCGLSENLLDCYELGKNEIRLDELLKISYVLNVKIEKLIAEEAVI